MADGERSTLENLRVVERTTHANYRVLIAKRYNYLERFKAQIMQSYPLAEIHDRQHEVLELASVEPVLLVEESQPSYVLMSAHNYQKLVERLALLEDYGLGQLAKAAIEHSQMVGTEVFTTELQRLASLDESN
jgi:PHD/YefM family antitoxin component YafN of YafNO toxin-antitoxin module